MTWHMFENWQQPPEALSPLVYVLCGEISARLRNCTIQRGEQPGKLRLIQAAPRAHARTDVQREGTDGADSRRGVGRRDTPSQEDRQVYLPAACTTDRPVVHAPRAAQL